MWSSELEVCLADLRLTRAQVRFSRALHEWVRKYRPDQPRVPKGTPLGGQWVAQLGRAVPGQGPDGRIHVSQIDGPMDGYSVNLLAEELKGPPGNKGHAVARHVGKTSDELINLLASTYRITGQTPIERQFKALRAWGSFRTIQDANSLVSQALHANRAQVDRVVGGVSTQETIVYRFGFPTGVEAYWVNPEPPPAVRFTFAVTIIIRSDPYSPRRFRVHTAYPMNEDHRREIVQ